ncbi:MAG: hypothetical protein WD969_02110 [Paracoccaceae bacterium]
MVLIAATHVALFHPHGALVAAGPRAARNRGGRAILVFRLQPRGRRVAACGPLRVIAVCRLCGGRPRVAWRLPGISRQLVGAPLCGGRSIRGAILRALSGFPLRRLLGLWPRALVLHGFRAVIRLGRAGLLTLIRALGVLALVLLLPALLLGGLVFLSLLARLPRLALAFASCGGVLRLLAGFGRVVTIALLRIGLGLFILVRRLAGFGGFLPPLLLCGGFAIPSCFFLALLSRRGLLALLGFIILCVLRVILRGHDGPRLRLAVRDRRQRLKHHRRHAERRDRLGKPVGHVSLLGPIIALIASDLVGHFSNARSSCFRRGAGDKTSIVRIGSIAARPRNSPLPFILPQIAQRAAGQFAS